MNEEECISRVLHRHDSLAIDDCKEIGTGGFSTVSVRKKKDGKIIAVKTMNTSNELFSKLSRKDKDKLVHLLLKQEFTIGRLLDHPFIIRTLELDLPTFEITFEYCKGMDLLDYLNATLIRKHLPKFCKYFHQLSSAMVYMHHTKGIAHMDIKLENIMIDFVTDNIKLIDFGQSKLFLSESDGLPISQKGRIGTLEYMPPEVIQLASYNPAKVDLWCAGVVLYNLVYDRMPKLLSSFFHKSYVVSIHNSKFKVDSTTFPDIYDNDVIVSKKDQMIFCNVFEKMFQYVPSKRSTFEDVLKAFSELSFLQNE